MRTYAALTLLVSVTCPCHGEDWSSVHRKGVEAANIHDFESSYLLFRKCRESAQTVRQRAVTDNDIGIVLYEAGRDSEAKVSLERSLAEWKTVAGADDQIAQTSGALGTVHRQLGEYSDAENLLRIALAQAHTANGARSYLLTTLGDLLREEGRFAEARNLLKEAEGLSGASWRQQFQQRVTLAELDRDTENWDASAEEWNSAAALATERHYPSGEAVCARGLGQTWLEQKNLARSEPLLKKALALFENDPHRDPAQVAITLTSLGHLYLSEDKAALAEDALSRALKVDEQSLGPTHPQVALVLESLAESFALRNQVERARSYFDRAETIMTARFGERSSITAGVLANRGTLEQRMNHPDLAAIQFRKALETLRSNDADGRELRSRIVKKYADALKATHHKREAEALLAQ